MHNYYFETINECEKEIIDKTIVLDIIYESNLNLFSCLIRTVRSAILWISILVICMAWVLKGPKVALWVFISFVIISIFGKLIISWAEFNHNRTYNNMKINLVDALTMRCKEYQETNYEDWQKKQMLKRFASLANIDIDWDNVK